MGASLSDLPPRPPRVPWGYVVAVLVAAASFLALALGEPVPGVG